MKSQIDKTENKQASQEPGRGATGSFVDNRSGTLVQRKLQEGMGNRPGNEATAQLRKNMQEGSTEQTAPIQRKANDTGLPDNLKSGIENLSGFGMDDVKVHYNSSKPAQLQAHAYAQGTDIHLGPGQEKHLAHEAWHVVQQKQGRVKPTRQLKSKVNINDNIGLEKEADVMGAKALRSGGSDTAQRSSPVQRVVDSSVIQRFSAEEYAELDYFLMMLQGLMMDSQNEHGGVFSLVELDELMEDVDLVIELEFYNYLSGARPADTEVGFFLKEKLDKIFGFDKVDELKRRLFNGIAWGEVKHKGKGYLYEAFTTFPHNRGIYAEMLAKYGGHPQAEEFLQGVIESGTHAPTGQQVATGDIYYKLMPPGADFMSSPSPFFLTRTELQRVLASRNLADHLGLPIVNYSAYYCVYEITALAPNKVFQSTIAATEQKVKLSQKIVQNAGGRQQTIILDSMDRTLWAKTAKPVYILDPDEAELLALGGIVDG